MMKPHDYGMATKKISQFDWPSGDTSCHGQQISVHTRELAPETDSYDVFAPGACVLQERAAEASSLVCIGLKKLRV